MTHLFSWRKSNGHFNYQIRIISGNLQKRLHSRSSFVRIKIRRKKYRADKERISHFILFFMNEDKIISKEELLEKLWNDKYYLDENVLLVNMTRLKKKMKEIGIIHLLENIRGKGWKL